MSKGTRFVTIAIPAVVAYLLMLINVLPVPFVSAETADQILPVVSAAAVEEDTFWEGYIC